jgi:hypothetical protein
LNTTTSYAARRSGTNTAASSVTSTVKPCAAPSFLIATTPASMDPCLKPAVLDMTRIRDDGASRASGCGWQAAAARPDVTAASAGQRRYFMSANLIQKREADPI